MKKSIEEIKSELEMWEQEHEGRGVFLITIDNEKDTSVLYNIYGKQLTASLLMIARKNESMRAIIKMVDTILEEEEGEKKN